MKQDIENTSAEKNDLDFIARELISLEQQIENAQITLSDLENLYEKGMPVKTLSLKKLRVIYGALYSHLGPFLREQSEVWKTTLNPNKKERGDIDAIQNRTKQLDTVVNRILFLADNIETLSEDIEKFDLLEKKQFDYIH